MYAINHAATVLPLKRYFPGVPLPALLVGSQVVELLWVAFQLSGVEHFSVRDDDVHLDFLPYSHSLATGLGMGLLSWLALERGAGQPELGRGIGMAVASHVLLDLAMHEPDIRPAPMGGPGLGLNLYSRPPLAFAVELGYGVACWRVYRGSRGLLAAIVLFNVADAPLMFPQLRPGLATFMGRHRRVLPLVILAQIVAAWVAVGLLAGRQRRLKGLAQGK